MSKVKPLDARMLRTIARRQRRRMQLNAQHWPNLAWEFMSAHLARLEHEAARIERKARK